MARKRKLLKKRLIPRKAELVIKTFLGVTLLTLALIFGFSKVLDKVEEQQAVSEVQSGQLSGSGEGIEPRTVIAPEAGTTGKKDSGRTSEDPTASNSSPLEESIRLNCEEIVTTDVDCNWRLILVNPTHRLPNDFWVDTKSLPDEDTGSIDERIYDLTMEMLEACEHAGFRPVIRGAYRTFSQQQELYDDKVDSFVAQGISREQAELDAATIIALPGTSEHQLGLALDIVSVEADVLNEAQEDTPTQQWLMEHCWEYGFVLRYPPDKSDLTGIIYEPWHYRYVGKEAAKIMNEKDLCLEEYLELYGNGG